MYTNNIYKIIKEKYLNIFPSYSMKLDRLMLGCDSVLDVGCGSDSPLKYIENKPYCVGIDGFEPSIKRSKIQKIHNEYIKMNLDQIDKKFNKDSYDCVLASDVLEHFTKEEGDIFLKKLEEIAVKKVIIFTPNGFVPQGRYEDNPWQVHKSGWTPLDMKKRGFFVTGVAGLKYMRGNFSELKYRPHFLWRILSDITQLFTKNHPKYAFSILCVKEI